MKHATILNMIIVTIMLSSVLFTAIGRAGADSPGGQTINTVIDQFGIVLQGNSTYNTTFSIEEARSYEFWFYSGVEGQPVDVLLMTESQFQAFISTGINTSVVSWYSDGVKTDVSLEQGEHRVVLLANNSTDLLAAFSIKWYSDSPAPWVLITMLSISAILVFLVMGRRRSRV